MYEVGDIVEICFQGNFAYPDCPALNLEGSLAKIIKKEKSNRIRETYFYKLQFIEIHAKKPELIDDHDGMLNWEEKHFIPAKDKYTDLDIMELFNETD